MVGIASGVNQHCPSCELEQTNITNGEFQCFPGSPNQVTFRAKVHDRAQATAREVITYIEQWITSSDMVTLPVHHARLKINDTCVVLLDSLDDPECPENLTSPSQAITSSVGDTTDDPKCPDELITLSEPVHTTISSTDDIYSSTESTKERETTSTLMGTLNQAGFTSQQMTTTVTNDQLITSPQLTTGILNQQPQTDTEAIVGGAVAIVFTITAGIVVMFALYSILKYCQTTNQIRYNCSLEIN